MGRSRSPLENAVYAFIALSLFARLAGVLFTASTAGGHGASALSVWADVSSAVAYVLIGVELLVLILLVATGRYVLAAGVALLMGFGFIYEGVHRDSAGAAGHRPAAPAATPGPRSGPAFDASGAVISFFARVEDVRKGSLSAAQLACEEMSPAAQIQIARALAGRAYGLGSWVTAGSRKVVTSPSSRPSAISRSRRRMIFPERVLGRSSAQIMRFGLANLPMRSATVARMPSSVDSSPSRFPCSVTKATIAWPVSSSCWPITAASATSGWATIADSTSAVESRWPETLTTSSMRPITQKYPSASRRAASPTR